MKYFIIVIVIALQGCGIHDWSNALHTHKCTIEQFSRAIAEARQLEMNDDSGKYFEYWMGNSVIRICEKI